MTQSPFSAPFVHVATAALDLQPPSNSLVMCINIDSSIEDTCDTAPSLLCNPHANAITLCCCIFQYSNIVVSSLGEESELLLVVFKIPIEISSHGDACSFVSGYLLTISFGRGHALSERPIANTSCSRRSVRCIFTKLHRPSSKGTKLLFHVIKATINQVHEKLAVRVPVSGILCC